MQRKKYSPVISSGLLLSLSFILLVNTVFAQSLPSVPPKYQRLFEHYADRRVYLEKMLNLVGLTRDDIGRSFALIAGVSHYPNMDSFQKDLQPAAEDIKKLTDYLKNVEFFDEIVVLKNGDMTYDNLSYFLQAYFPSRLEKFPKSRFLFAYSGHGITEGANGYVLLSTARNMSDKENAINMRIIRALFDEVIESGYHVLALINSCYSGAFIKRSFGNRHFLPRHKGAHAITAGATSELTWHDKAIGSGSIFFEKLFAGLNGYADSIPKNGDGVVTVDELVAYLRQEVQISTDQSQNPQGGDVSRNGSLGGFFFLNRGRQVERGVLAQWNPDRGVVFGKQENQRIVEQPSASQERLNNPTVVKRSEPDIPSKTLPEVPKLASKTVKSPIHERHTLQGHTGDVNSVAFSPDGNTIVSGSNDKTVRLWDVTTGKLQHTLTDHPEGVSAVRFSPDGQILASLNPVNGIITLWDLTTRRKIRTFSDKEGFSYLPDAITFSPDGRMLAAARSPVIILWDVVLGQELRRLHGHSNGTLAVAFSLDGKLLASGGNDGLVRLWRSSTWEQTHVLKGHYYPVGSIAFSPNGEFLATADGSSGGSKTPEIKLWDPTTATLLHTFQGHTNGITHISFSPDGVYLASASLDHALKIWNVPSRNMERTLQGHGKPVNDVAWSSDGTTVASGGWDNKVKLWGP